MNILKIRLSLVLLMSSLLVGCENVKTTEPTPKISDSELSSLITKQVDSLYSVFEKCDIDWIEFYAEKLYSNLS